MVRLGPPRTPGRLTTNGWVGRVYCVLLGPGRGRRDDGGQALHELGRLAAAEGGRRHG